MNWWQPHNFESKIPHLQTRMQIIKTIRKHFDDQGFWEVETPILQTMPGADIHIHAYKVENNQYLHNSPEFAMKKLLVALSCGKCPKIYQICKTFRKEERTKLHNPEFTMIEWYRAGVDYTAIMDDCKTLLRQCAAQYRFNDTICNPNKDWQKITVCEAFEQYAGINLNKHLPSSSGLTGRSFTPQQDPPVKPEDDKTRTFAKAATAINIRTTPTDTWDDIFHAIMAKKIEPHLGNGAPTILYEYPAHMAALARKKPNDPQFAERFELYVCGIELANAFTELTDSAEQRARFETDMKEKQKIYGESYPIDEDFLAALNHGLPDCAGIALGVDRLTMLASGAGDIQDVLWCV